VLKYTFNVCKVTGVKLDSELRYVRVPKFVETSNEGKITILWNQLVETHRTIPNNDIIIQGNEKRTYMLIYVASSGDRNMIKKDGEESLKYKDLTIEIQPI
jgi:hypothetical protein